MDGIHHVFRPIFIFFCKYENEWNKYRNTPLPAWSSSMGRGKKEKPLISTTSIQEKRFFFIPILGATTSDLHRRRYQFDCSSDFLPTADRNFSLLLFTTSTTRQMSSIFGQKLSKDTSDGQLNFRVNCFPWRMKVQNPCT